MIQDPPAQVSLAVKGWVQLGGILRRARTSAACFWRAAGVSPAVPAFFGDSPSRTVCGSVASCAGHTFVDVTGRLQLSLSTRQCYMLRAGCLAWVTKTRRCPDCTFDHDCAPKDSSAGRTASAVITTQLLAACNRGQRRTAVVRGGTHVRTLSASLPTRSMLPRPVAFSARCRSRASRQLWAPIDTGSGACTAPGGMYQF